LDVGFGMLEMIMDSWIVVRMHVLELDAVFGMCLGTNISFPNSQTFASAKPSLSRRQQFNLNMLRPLSPRYTHSKLF